MEVTLYYVASLWNGRRTRKLNDVQTSKIDSTTVQRHFFTHDLNVTSDVLNLKIYTRVCIVGRVEKVLYLLCFNE